MIHKIFATTLTVLITVSSLSAYALVFSDCPDPSCCCCQSVATAGKMETGHPDNGLKIQTLNRCCCGETDGNTCSLTTVTPLKNIEWALSPNRFDPSFYILFDITSTDDGGSDSDITFHTVPRSEIIHPGSPPIYLSAMSFLC